MRGFFAVGVYHPKKQVNIGTLWRTAHAYGAQFIFTIGARYHKQPSDTTKAYRHVPLMNFVDTDDLMEHLPYGCKLIGVELSDGATPLPAMKHPHQAAYLLGAEDHGIPEYILQSCHELIQIPTGEPFCLNVATAGSIVMYDRFVKAHYEPL